MPASDVLPNIASCSPESLIVPEQKHDESVPHAVGSDVEWFKLHDVDRRSSGEIEAAVCLAAACVDIDKRRAMYALPLAVAPEKRVTRGQLEK